MSYKRNLTLILCWNKSPFSIFWSDYILCTKRKIWFLPILVTPFDLLLDITRKCHWYIILLFWIFRLFCIFWYATSLSFDMWWAYICNTNEEAVRNYKSLNGFSRKISKNRVCSGNFLGCFFLLCCLGPNEHISTAFACVAIMPHC